MGGLILPGWTCPAAACGLFNGEAKQRLARCRCCGSARPADLDAGAVVHAARARPLFRIIPVGRDEERGERLELLRELAGAGYLLTEIGGRS